MYEECSKKFYKYVDMYYNSYKYLWNITNSWKTMEKR